MRRFKNTHQKYTSLNKKRQNIMTPGPSLLKRLHFFLFFRKKRVTLDLKIEEMDRHQ